MSDLFLDTNICVYGFDDSNIVKQDTALGLLKDKPRISSQVIIETYITCSRKLKLPPATCENITRLLCEITAVMPIDSSVFAIALKFKARFQFSFLDAVIVASALEAGCTTLYSEDLHHGLVIENKLTIVNPFI